MTKKDICDYRLIDFALDRCQARIRDLCYQQAPMITDSVRGSNTEYPYEMRTYKIIAPDKKWQKERDLQLKLAMCEINRLRLLKLEVEAFVDSIDDVRDKAIIECMMDGLTQEEIGRKLYMSQSLVSKSIAKYFDS